MFLEIDFKAIATHAWEFRHFDIQNKNMIVLNGLEQLTVIATSANHYY
ncbi:MAG: hypothetical protein AAF378_16660 [Cyanobacteria bacterium P01_A01_bin.84]